MKDRISIYPYQKILEEIEKIQGKKSAVIILENNDGSTTYVRYNISEEAVIEMLSNAYSQRNIVDTYEDKNDINHDL